MPSQKNTESNQLGVVAGPFGQMLVNKEQVSSRRGSSFSLASSNLGAKDKLYVYIKHCFMLLKNNIIKGFLLCKLNFV